MKDWMAGPRIFDNWRERYDDLTWEDQVEFYSEVARRWPNQNHYLAPWFRSCLVHICDENPLDVFEIGGWTGAMACELLDLDFVSGWTNYEVCQWAVDNSVCDDIRYHAMVPEDFPWFVELPRAHVFLTSNTLEHIKSTEIAMLFRKLPESIRFMMHLLPPNIAVGVDWTDYGGSHIIDCGWNEIDGFASDCGFSVVQELCSLNGKMYER
jgi:hypothetical protein